MTHWFQLLRDNLRLSWLPPLDQAVPFGLTGVATADWKADKLGAAGDSRWALEAHTASGLEARWEVRFFEDSPAAECWGEVRHQGNEPIANIRESLTLDLGLTWPRDAGDPWVRTVNGVRFIPNFFPPHDFAVVDRQLVQTPQVYTPLNLTGLFDGRSSGENLPAAVLCEEKQRHGLAFFLEWSGLWRISLRQDSQDFGSNKEATTLRVQAGLWGLHLSLKPGQSLPLPRILITSFQGGLESGCNSLRRHIRRHITPKLNGQETLPPASFNHWFAYTNKFTHETLKPAVEACSRAGLEYFVVDAGWFQGGFRQGIGNWDVVDTQKFPDGIAAFARFVESQGMKYGTWFEPEWAHKGSDLCQRHPEWFLPSPPSSPWQGPGNPFHTPDYHLMNFGLPEVRQGWVNRIVQAYEKWHVRWIRWDFNQMPRPAWEHNVPEGQLGWRQIEHVIGLYSVLDQILQACPDLFIEQCASGGHRIDLGTIRRGHSFWMNDHTTQSDIVRFLQHGLNTFLPGNYPNTNLCQNRHDFTSYDFLCHSVGGFGYSGRLHEAPAGDFARFAEAVRQFKEFRPLLLGDYQRPTGQPLMPSDYERVVFLDAGKSVTLEFNVGGRREARCRKDCHP